MDAPSCPCAVAFQNLFWPQFVSCIRTGRSSLTLKADWFFLFLSAAGFYCLYQRRFGPDCSLLSELSSPKAPHPLLFLKESQLLLFLFYFFFFLLLKGQSALDLQGSGRMLSRMLVIQPVRLQTKALRPRERTRPTKGH